MSPLRFGMRPAALVFCTALFCGCVSPMRTLPAPDGVNGFGARIIALPDIDGDGTTDLAVSARCSQPLVQLFSGATGAWLGDIRLPDTEASGGTLMTAPLLCVVDGLSGRPAVLVVGLPSRSRAGQLPSGWVGAWSLETRQLLWESWGEAALERRGIALAALGDIDGDGVGDVAVGSGECQLAAGEWVPGRVFVFSGSTGAMLHVIGVPASSGCDDFGIALLALGDVDRDGVQDLVVQAQRAAGGRAVGECTPGGSRLCIVSVDGQKLRWIYEGTVADGPYAMLAALPDLDGDGAADLAVGTGADRTRKLTGHGHVLSLSSATGSVLADRDGLLPGEQLYSSFAMDPTVSAQALASDAPEVAFAKNVAFVWRGARRVAVAIGDPDRATGEGQSGRVTIRPLP